LSKEGARIRLQEKPLRVLAALAERQGQLVTREDLKKRLWPDDTFVDFETGLNTAVSKLRDALSDNAEKPRYIETIPRRGYRCIMAVEVIAEGGSLPNDSSVPAGIEPGGAATLPGAAAAQPLPAGSEAAGPEIAGQRTAASGKLLRAGLV